MAGGRGPVPREEPAGASRPPRTSSAHGRMNQGAREQRNHPHAGLCARPQAHEDPGGGGGAGGGQVPIHCFASVRPTVPAPPPCLDAGSEGSAVCRTPVRWVATRPSAQRATAWALPLPPRSQPSPSPTSAFRSCGDPRPWGCSTGAPRLPQTWFLAGEGSPWRPQAGPTQPMDAKPGRQVVPCSPVRGPSPGLGLWAELPFPLTPLGPISPLTRGREASTCLHRLCPPRLSGTAVPGQRRQMFPTTWVARGTRSVNGDLAEQMRPCPDSLPPPPAHGPPRSQRRWRVRMGDREGGGRAACSPLPSPAALSSSSPGSPPRAVSS